jgi:hypothetical protein
MEGGGVALGTGEPVFQSGQTSDPFHNVSIFTMILQSRS